MDQQIKSKKIACMLGPQEGANKISETALTAFAEKRDIKQAVLFSGGHLLLVCDTRSIILRSGMATLGKDLSLPNKPERLHLKNLLEDFFNLPGVDFDKLAVRIGDRFTEDYARAISKKETNKRTNPKLLKQTPLQAVRSGAIPLLQVRQLKDSQQIVREMEEEERAPPDNHAPKTYTFSEHRNGRKVEGGPETSFVLTPRLNDPKVKKRHVFIYSMGAGWGKSHFAEDVMAKLQRDVCGRPEKLVRHAGRRPVYHLRRVSRTQGDGFYRAQGILPGHGGVEQEDARALVQAAQGRSGHHLVQPLPL